MTITAPAIPTTKNSHLVGAVLVALVLVALVVAGFVVTRPAPVPVAQTQTNVERTYLNLMYPRGADAAQTKRGLTLGYIACRTMSSGSSDHAAYRTAVGALMADQVKPDWAELTAHSALVSGLCLAL